MRHRPGRRCGTQPRRCAARDSNNPRAGSARAVTHKRGLIDLSPTHPPTSFSSAVVTAWRVLVRVSAGRMQCSRTRVRSFNFNPLRTSLLESIPCRSTSRSNVTTGGVTDGVTWSVAPATNPRSPGRVGWCQINQAALMCHCPDRTSARIVRVPSGAAAKVEFRSAGPGSGTCGRSDTTPPARGDHTRSMRHLTHQQPKRAQPTTDATPDNPHGTCESPPTVCQSPSHPHSTASGTATPAN